MTPEQIDRYAIAVSAWILRTTPADVVAARLRNPDAPDVLPLPASVMANLEADMQAAQERAAKEGTR